MSLILTITDEACQLEFQSPLAVLPNGSYAVPLDTVQNNSVCHLNLNETNGPVMEDFTSNSGNFLVNVQCVVFIFSSTS